MMITFYRYEKLTVPTQQEIENYFNERNMDKKIKQTEAKIEKNVKTSMGKLLKEDVKNDKKIKTAEKEKRDMKKEKGC